MLSIRRLVDPTVFLNFVQIIICNYTYLLIKFLFVFVYLLIIGVTLFPFTLPLFLAKPLLFFSLRYFRLHLFLSVLFALLLLTFPLNLWLKNPVGFGSFLFFHAQRTFLVEPAFIGLIQFSLTMVDKELLWNIFYSSRDKSTIPYIF